MIKIGSHISFNKKNGYLIGAVEESINNGANCMMIYLGAPQTSRRASVNDYNIEEYKTKYSHLIKPEDIIIHAPYITNPANIEKHEFAINFLIEEIERMNSFGAKYLVLHPGAYTKFAKQDAIKQLITSLKTILDKTTGVDILLETMSGKGTEIGDNFEDLKHILDKVNEDRLGICFDTCHVWDSGIDIRDYDNVIKLLKENDLFKYIKVFHINDSKNELGSRKDRHANMKQGYIEFESLKKIVNSKDFTNIPMILETPWVDDKPIYKEEIKLLLDK